VCGNCDNDPVAFEYSEMSVFSNKGCGRMARCVLDYCTCEGFPDTAACERELRCVPVSCGILRHCDDGDCLVNGGEVAGVFLGAVVALLIALCLYRRCRRRSPVHRPDNRAALADRGPLARAASNVSLKQARPSANALDPPPAPPAYDDCVNLD
jgi:hypothetical protein